MTTPFYEVPTRSQFKNKADYDAAVVEHKKEAVEEIMKDYEQKQIAVTCSRGDVKCLLNIVDTGLDTSGIIYHILDELGVDL